MEREWEKEKEKILNSLLGSTQELEFPTEAEVCCRQGRGWGRGLDRILSNCRQGTWWG